MASYRSDDHGRASGRGEHADAGNEVPGLNAREHPRHGEDFAGLSRVSNWRIWQSFGLKLHRTETCKLSQDPMLIEKVRDMVGPFPHPPDRALVLCVDEKPQIRGLNRTAPLLPMRPGQAERRTHEYRRQGTSSWFAAFDAKAGKLVGKTRGRHRAIEFRRFLDHIDAAVAADLDVHLSMDHGPWTTTARIKRRPSRRGRPSGPATTCTSRRPTRPGSTKSNDGSCPHQRSHARTAILEHIGTSNDTGQPFIWTKSADDILASIARFAALRGPVTCVTNHARAPPALSRPPNLFHRIQ